MTETSTLPALVGGPEIFDLAASDRDAMLTRLAEQVTATAGNAPAELEQLDQVMPTADAELAALASVVRSGSWRFP